jgi:hypothetical protein
LDEVGDDGPAADCDCPGLDPQSAVPVPPDDDEEEDDDEAATQELFDDDPGLNCSWIIIM